MHTSSLKNMKDFVEKYLVNEKHYRILDLGSQEVEGDDNGSYKLLFQKDEWEYIGADLVPGRNVDVVLKSAYRWDNLEDDSFDVIACGQMFEHDEFFWLTMFEIRRVLKRDGLCCIIAPSGGPEHRYPVDCYRFYPDGLKAVTEFAGLSVLDVYAQWNRELYPDMDDYWRDCVLVCRKTNPDEDKEYKRIKGILDELTKKVVDRNYPGYYTLETTWRQPSPDIFCSIYIDTGKGFNEEQVTRYPLKTREGFNIEIDVPEDCKMIRFDALEGFRSLVEEFKITNAEDEAISEDIPFANGKKLGDQMYIFDTVDPQIFVPLEHNDRKYIISGKVFVLL